MSVRQSLKVETDSCAFDCESGYINLCVINIQVMTEIMIVNDLAERRSI